MNLNELATDPFSCLLAFILCLLYVSDSELCSYFEEVVEISDMELLLL